MLDKPNDELIFKLREHFINLNDNHNIKKMNALQILCENYLSKNEDNEHKHVENTTYVLKGLIDYNLNDNRKSAYEKILPMLENLEFGKKEKLLESSYNRYLLIYSIALCKNYKQANSILKIIENSFENSLANESLKSKSLSCAYINFTENLLYSKLYREITALEENKIINKLFQETCEKARKILLKKDRYDLLVVLSIKEQAFYKSNVLPKEIEELNEIRKNAHQEEFHFLRSIELNIKLMEFVIKLSEIIPSFFGLPAKK